MIETRSASDGIPAPAAPSLAGASGHEIGAGADALMEARSASDGIPALAAPSLAGASGFHELPSSRGCGTTTKLGWEPTLLGKPGAQERKRRDPRPRGSVPRWRFGLS